jgi:hypothetical protein
VILDTLFGEGQTGPKILLFLVVVLGLAVRRHAAGSRALP